MEFRVILVVFLSLFLSFLFSRSLPLSFSNTSSITSLSLFSLATTPFSYVFVDVCTVPRCSTTQITLSPYRWLGHATTWTKGRGRAWIFTVSRTGIPPSFHRRRSRTQHCARLPAGFQREAIRERPRPATVDCRSPRLFRKTNTTRPRIQPFPGQLIAG